MASNARPAQKSFTLGQARPVFEAWCSNNGYDERAVFFAGWLALRRMSHDERTQLFREVAVEIGGTGPKDPASLTVEQMREAGGWVEPEPPPQSGRRVGRKPKAG